MLPLVPILFLAYAVLYAFAQPIQSGFVEQSVQDAIAMPVARALVEPSHDISVFKSRRPETISVSVDTQLNVGEKKGFFHECRSASPACSEG